MIFFSSFKQKNIASFDSKEAAIFFLTIYSLAVLGNTLLLPFVFSLHVFYISIFYFDPFFVFKLFPKTKLRTKSVVKLFLSFSHNNDITLEEWLSKAPIGSVIVFCIEKHIYDYEYKKCGVPVIDNFYNLEFDRKSCLLRCTISVSSSPGVSEWIDICPLNIDKKLFIKDYQYTREKYHILFSKSTNQKYSVINITNIPLKERYLSQLVDELTSGSVFVQKWMPLSESHARDFWNNKKNDFIGFYFNKSSIEIYAENAQKALEAIEKKSCLFGFWHGFILIPMENDKVSKDIPFILRQCMFLGFSAYHDVHLCGNSDLFDAQPFFIHHNYCITSYMISVLFNIPNHSHGDPVNLHFEKTINSKLSLMDAFDSTGSPYSINFHDGDVGHVSIFGPTGSGKSVFISISVLNFLKYPRSRILILDKDAAMNGFVLSLNACGVSTFIFDLSTQGLPWRLNTVSLKRDFCALLFKDIETHDDIINDFLCTLSMPFYDLEDIDSLYDVGMTIFSRKMSSRISNMINLYGSLLHGYNDDTDLNQRVILCTFDGFNNLSGTILSVCNFLIFSFLESSSYHDSVSLYVIDEMWFFLKDEFFLSQIITWLRTFRKRNVSVMMATQEIQDCIDHNLDNILISSCKSMVFLPNPNANHMKDIYSLFQLDDKCIHAISTMKQKQWYLFCRKSDKVWCDFRLTPERINYLFDQKEHFDKTIC